MRSMKAAVSSSEYSTAFRKWLSRAKDSMEGMEQVFEQCQQFEEKRLRFFREVLLEVQKHLDLSNMAR